MARTASRSLGSATRAATSTPGRKLLVVAVGLSAAAGVVYTTSGTTTEAGSAAPPPKVAPHDYADTKAAQGLGVIRPEDAYVMKIFAGSSNKQLANAISKELGVPLGKIRTDRFNDGECNVQILENVRGADVFLVQATCSPVNENLMELLVMLDAFKRSSPARIIAVIPYYGYARQDTKLAPRVPISARLVADLLHTAGATRVITVDLHAAQIQGFFDLPLDNLIGVVTLSRYFKSKKDLANLVVVSPDAGGVKRAAKLRDMLSDKDTNPGLAVISKQRAAAGVVESMQLVGNVKGCDCIIIDDLIDTAGTLVKAAELVKEAGARRVFAVATHGVLSPPAADRITKSILEEVVITDSIPLTEERKSPKITQLSVAPLLAESIRRIHLEQSVSSLFDIKSASHA